MTDLFQRYRWLRWLVGAQFWFGFLDPNKKTSTTSINTEYANSFNTSSSYATSTTGGDTSLVIGAPGGTGSTLGQTFPLIIGVLGVLAGIFMLTK